MSLSDMCVDMASDIYLSICELDDRDDFLRGVPAELIERIMNKIVEKAPDIYLLTRGHFHRRALLEGIPLEFQERIMHIVQEQQQFMIQLRDISTLFV